MQSESIRDNNLAQIAQYYSPVYKNGKLGLKMRAAECREFLRLLGAQKGGVTMDKLELRRSNCSEHAHVIITSEQHILGFVRMGLNFIGMTSFFDEHGPKNHYLRNEVKKREVRLAEGKLIEYMEDGDISEDSDDIIVSNISQRERDEVVKLAEILNLKHNVSKDDHSWEGKKTEYDVMFSLSDINKIKEKLAYERRWTLRVEPSELLEKEKYFEQEVDGFISFLSELDFYKEKFQDRIGAILPKNTDINSLLAASDELDLSMEPYRVGDSNGISFAGLANLQLLAELGLDFTFQESGKSQSFAQKYTYLSTMMR